MAEPDSTRRKYRLKRPSSAKTNLVCRLTEQELARLDRLSELTGISSRSEIVRIAIVRLLQEEERRVERPT